MLTHGCFAGKIVEYAGHFYELSTGAATFDQAKAQAAASTYRGLRGHLVTFHGTTEGPAVAALVGASPFWTAASDNTTEGAWVWTAGPEAGKSVDPVLQWHKNEPSGAKTENCGEYGLRDGAYKHNDLACSTARLFVIEYECDLSASIDNCFGKHA
jgi:hypothetical protein